MGIFFISVLSWALIPGLSRAQTSGLCSHLPPGRFCVLQNRGHPCHFSLAGRRQGQGTLKGQAGLDFITRLGSDRGPLPLTACSLLPSYRPPGICWGFSSYGETGETWERRRGCKPAPGVGGNLTQKHGCKRSLFNQKCAAEMY